MANIVLESDYWETSGIRDIVQNKTQRQINAEVNGEIDGLQDIVGDGSLTGFTATDLTGAANELKGSLNTNETAIAIVANGNTHAAIASGQYVYIKNHSSLSDGLYKAVTAIPLNDTLSSTNVSTVVNGGLNNLIPDYQTGNAETFFEGSYTALNGMRWAKSGKVVTAYFDVHYQDGSGTIMGTVKPEFRPNTGGNYVFATLFDTTPDVYKPVGAVWIYDNGTCRAYFEPNTNAKYASITYVTAE